MNCKDLRRIFAQNATEMQTRICLWSKDNHQTSLPARISILTLSLTCSLSQNVFASLHQTFSLTHLYVRYSRNLASRQLIFATHSIGGVCWSYNEQITNCKDMRRIFAQNATEMQMRLVYGAKKDYHWISLPARISILTPILTTLIDGPSFIMLSRKGKKKKFIKRIPDQNCRDKSGLGCI